MARQMPLIPGDGIGPEVADATALMQSAVPMLAHIGEREAAARLQSAIEQVYADGECLTGDVDGKGSTAEFTDAAIRRL